MKNKAFSLIELLVVVAIIGILSAILIPNVRENLRRAKVAKTAAMIGSIEMTLEIYNNDFGQYPPSFDLQGLFVAVTQDAQTPYEPDADEYVLMQQGEAYWVNEQRPDIGDTLDQILDSAGVPPEGRAAQREENVFVDAWGTPLYYVSHDVYNPGGRADFRRTSNPRLDAPCAYQMRGGERYQPYNPRSFQLISFGADGVTIIPSNNNGGIGSMLSDDDLDNDGDDFIDLGDQVRNPSELGEPEGTAEDDITNFGG